MKTFFFTTLALVILPFFLAPTVFAQNLPCGNIIDQNGDSESIQDCTDPFKVTTDPINNYSLIIDGVFYVNGATIPVAQGGTNRIAPTGAPLAHTNFRWSLYKHDGNDYRYVDLEQKFPTSEYFISYLEIYFTDPQVRDFYGDLVRRRENREDISADLYRDGHQWDPIIDPTNGDAVVTRLEGFYLSADYDFDASTDMAGSGKYTMVITEYSVYQTNNSIWDKIHQFIIPTAHAQFLEDYTYIVNFTVVEEGDEPEGASSVLFLPGIQASRLYIDPVILNEDQVWPPNSVLNNDIKDLSMTLSGISEKNVYTRDIIDTTSGAGDIHKNFLSFMNQLDSEGKIESWKPYAYDWRYGVNDIANNGTLYESGVKDVIDEIEILAASSFTDKVTIIGHSNGGLLAKAIMMRLEADGKSNLVDKVILLASPQLGTPKAIGTILHGYDQTDTMGGIVMDGQIVRRVLNNMPGAYGLLPSEKYFNDLSEPLVVFNDNSSTLPYRNIYGSSISNYSDMTKFVKGEDGLDRSLENPINKPARSNIGLIEQALINNNNLDNWVAPQGVEVIEIVGTGLPTMKAVEYREITETKCASAGAGGQVCVEEGEIKPYARLSHYGDGTVVQRSAEGYEGEKRKFFVNLLLLENSSLSGEYVHHNIIEAPPVQDLLFDLIISTTTRNNEFISTNYTTFDDPYDVEIIDSPVRLLSTDSQGNQTGVVIVNGVRTIKEEIPGSQYFEFGDTKYFVVPKGTNRTTKLYGEANGGYSLTTISFGVNDTQTIDTVLKNATTTPTMLAEYKNTSAQYSNITTDINGDGAVDTTTSMSGKLVVIVTYPLLVAKIQSSSLSKIYKQALLLIINSAQVYANKTTQVTLNKKIERGLLTAGEELVKLYVKKGYINQLEGQSLLQMITVLKNK